MAFNVITKAHQCKIEEGAKIVNMRHTLQSYYSLTSTYNKINIISFESFLQRLFKFFASIHHLVFGCLFFICQRLGDWVIIGKLANTSVWSSSLEALLQRYYKFLSQKSLQNLTMKKTLLVKEKSVNCGVPAKILCLKKASTLVENKRLDQDGQSIHSLFDMYT